MRRDAQCRRESENRVGYVGESDNNTVEKVVNTVSENQKKR